MDDDPDHVHYEEGAFVGPPVPPDKLPSKRVVDAHDAFETAHAGPAEVPRNLHPLRRDAAMERDD